MIGVIKQTREHRKNKQKARPFLLSLTQRQQRKRRNCIYIRLQAIDALYTNNGGANHHDHTITFCVTLNDASSKAYHVNSSCPWNTYARCLAAAVAATGSFQAENV